jgi:RND family efflux transporter MFP subunit
MRNSGLFIFLLTVYAVSCSCAKQKSIGEDAVRTVKVDTAVMFIESREASFPGKIRAADDVSLSFRIAGQITKINVTEGSRVCRGQTLATLDARDYEIQLAATEAEYSSIKAEAGRVIALHETGSVSDNDYDKAVYGLKQITAKYDAHKNALADTRLLAPFDGYIQKIHFNQGETVGAGMPVLLMIDAGAPEVEINIPASEYIKKDRFDRFSCTVDIFPEKTFALDLIGITHQANMNQLYTARLKMRTTDGQLPSPGMVTMVNITYLPEESAPVSIPYSAIFDSNSTTAVWIFDSHSETVALREVTASEIRRDGTVIIDRGLSVGEIVVAAGVHSLKNGQRVRMLQPSAESNVGGEM